MKKRYVYTVISSVTKVVECKRGKECLFPNHLLPFKHKHAIAHNRYYTFLACKRESHTGIELFSLELNRDTRRWVLSLSHMESPTFQTMRKDQFTRCYNFIQLCGLNS